jgi:hypothetical protein
LNWAVSAGGICFELLAPGFDALAFGEEADRHRFAWIFSEAVRQERVRVGVSGAAAQRQDDVGGEGEQNWGAGSGAMMVMRCRS